MNNSIIIFIIIIVAGILLYPRFVENLRVCGYNHCPKNCSQFLYPDMYSPQGPICNDPFSWGFQYSTGPCPHIYKK